MAGESDLGSYTGEGVGRLTSFTGLIHLHLFLL
jgi:hypothetical protein